MLQRLSLVLALCFCPLLLAETSDVTRWLEEADAIKSSDRARFSQLLAQLKLHNNQLNTAQRSQLRYLDAYSTAFDGNYTDAITQFERLIAEDDTALAAFKARATLINMYTLAKRYTEAFNISEEAVSKITSLSDKQTSEQLYRVIALLHNNVGDYDSGNYFATNIIRQSANLVSVCAAWQLKIEAQFHLAQADDFDQQVTQALQACELADSQLFIFIIQAFNARKALQQAKPQLAAQILTSHLTQVETMAYPPLVAGYHALLAKVYLQLNEDERAISHATKATEAGLTTQYSEQLSWAYEVLYEVNKKKGVLHDALNYLEKFRLHDKAYLDSISAGQLALNLARSATQAKMQQIALLNKDNELLSLQKNIYQQEIKQSRLIVLVLVSVLLLGSVLAYRAFAGRVKFKKIAEYDQLTGVSNRYHFTNQAQIALEYCDKNAKPVALILFDLDHFKHINDTHGHAVGDWALQAVVKTCRNFMRNNDVFGRIGGEEFAVVLPGCHADKAALLAEICRDAIASIDTSTSGYEFPLSASFGVSSSESSGYLLKQLLADADSAMYRAKAAGRDQVIAYSRAC